MKDWPMFIVSPAAPWEKYGNAIEMPRVPDPLRPAIETMISNARAALTKDSKRRIFGRGEQEEMIACLICGVRKDSAVEKYCVAEIDGFNKKHGLNLTFGCEVPPTEEHSFVEMPGLPVYYGVSLVDDFIAKFNGLDRKPEPVSTAVLLEDFNRWEGSR
jgi:hypothetical protein